MRLELLAKHSNLTAELVLPQRVGERCFELGRVERLADEVRGTQLHRLDDRRGAPLTREDYHGHVAIDFLEGRQRSQPVHTARNDHVKDHCRWTLRVVALDRFLGVAHGDWLVAAFGEKRLQENTRRQIIVHDHYLRLTLHKGGDRLRLTNV